jgi:RND family efflux transporter MFP subunit
MNPRVSKSFLVLLIAGVSLSGPLIQRVSASQAGDGYPASPVRYTEAKEHPVHRTIVLPGSVASRTESLVASEVEGLVVELAAREGTTVRQGQTIAQLRSDQLELRLAAAEADLREAEARLTLAENNLNRSRELFESQVLSQGQLDDSQSEFNAWQGRAQRLEAEIASIKLDIERSTIRAPFAGVVVAERCAVGEWIGRGDPVAELISLNDLEVEVDVPERYFSTIQSGYETTVEFESLPGYELSGKVSAVVPRANPQARTFPVKVRINNKDGKVGAGMLAQVSFSAGESYRATVVPKDAVITRGDRRYVYVLAEDSTVSQVPVETGVGAGAWVEVESGLKPGTKVVTRGNERLQSGQKVAGEPLEYQLP